MDKCPYCGCTSYSILVHYHGTGEQIFTINDDIPINKNNKYDCVKELIVREWAHCSNCQKRLFKVTERPQLLKL